MYSQISKNLIGRRIEVEYAGKNIRGTIHEISDDHCHLVLLVENICPRWISIGKDKLLGIGMTPTRYWKLLQKDIALTIVRRL